MIAIDFNYYRVNTIEEAVSRFQELHDAGMSPLFLNGGTEIITLMRVHALYTETRAVIDIKDIPACTTCEYQNDQLVIGSSVTLAFLEEMNKFPLLSKNCRRIADHTSREKITIGGNICGNIKYREAILPLLLTDCELLIAGESGVHKISIHDIFNAETGRIVLKPGSFVVQIFIDKDYLNLPFVSKKVTGFGRIGYPLLTVAAIKVKGLKRLAISGLCAYPFRSSQVEEALNYQTESIEQCVETAINQLPAPILDDAEASSAYREFVLRHILEESLTELKESL